jgi:hypothetical protein
MVNYTCLLCNKQFHKKYNFNMHNRRIIPCNKNKLDNNTSTNIINHFNPNAIKNTTINIVNDEQINQYNPNAIKIITHDDINNHLFDCSYCNKKFSLKHNLTRHLKNKCKKQLISDNNESQLSDLIKQNNSLIEQNIQLNNQNKIILQKLNSLEENIAIVSKSKNSKNNKTIKNINNTLNNNTQNNITINHIVNLGDEDISKLT